MSGDPSDPRGAGGVRDVSDVREARDGESAETPASVAVVERDSPRGVTITVDLAAIRANLVEARRLSGGGKVFAVVKADAYGHGAAAVARALSRGDQPPSARADGFAVVTTSEALALREAGIERPILVLQGPLGVADAAVCVEAGLWPVIHDVEQHAWFRDWTGARGRRQGEPDVWLKVDTGMGRLGVHPDAVTRLLGAGDGIRWRGVMSHLACADEPGSEHARAQIATFASLAVPPGLERSLANSAAVIGWPEARFDWARPGLMLYGCDPFAVAPSRGAVPTAALRPAMRVTTTLLSVRTMDAGQGVGYAQTWRCPERMAVGIARIGYGDGLPRVLGAGARVSVGGVDCPIVGRVSMDSIAIDLRAVPGARIGDEVELWGGRRSVDALAEAAGTIAYELLTGIRGLRRHVDTPPTKAGGAPSPPPRGMSDLPDDAPATAEDGVRG